MNEKSLPFDRSSATLETSFDEPDYLVILAELRKIIRAIDLYSKRTNLDTGLTTPQWLVLYEINKHDSMMVKDLAARVQLSPATVVSILDRLESRNVIERERSKSDKRRLKLHLTHYGQELFARVPALLPQSFVDAFANLDSDVQEQIKETLKLINLLMVNNEDK